MQNVNIYSSQRKYMNRQLSNNQISSMSQDKTNNTSTTTVGEPALLDSSPHHQQQQLEEELIPSSSSSTTSTTPPLLLSNHNHQNNKKEEQSLVATNYNTPINSSTPLENSSPSSSPSTTDATKSSSSPSNSPAKPKFNSKEKTPQEIYSELALGIAGSNFGYHQQQQQQQVGNNVRHSISIQQTTNRRGIAFELGRDDDDCSEGFNKKDLMDKADKRKSISIVSSLDIQQVNPISLHKKKKKNSPSSKQPSSNHPKGGLFMFFNNPRNSITKRFRASVSGKEMDDDLTKIQQEINDHERRRTLGTTSDEEVDEETKSFYNIIRNGVRRGSSKQLETPVNSGSFMVLDASPRIQSSDVTRTGPIQNVAMSLWTKVDSTIAFRLMDYCSLFEVSSLSRLNQEWLSFVKGYFSNHCDPENLRTCMLLLYFKLQGIFSNLRAEVSAEDRHLKSVYSVLLSHKHLLEQSLTNTSKNRISITTSRELGLGDLFLNTYLNNLFNIIPRVAYYTARKNERKVINFNEIQYSLTVEIFLRDETVVNTLDTYDIERYVQNYSGSFATQLIATSMAYFSVYYLKIENYTPATEPFELTEYTEAGTPEARRVTISGNTPTPNSKAGSFSSLKNLKLESNFEDTIEMFRSPRTPATPSSKNNSFIMDKGEFLIAKGSGTTKKRRESLASETGSVSSSISTPNINFNFIEIIPKDSSELGYLFLLEFFKILSKYIRRLTFSRKPHASERFRMDYFSTMSLSPNCETFSAFMTNEEDEFKKNSKKFKSVCNAIATSEALTCLVMGGKEWNQEDVNILFNSLSRAGDEIKRDNYKIDLILPCLLEISERCTKPKLRPSIFLPPPTSESLVSEINIAEIHESVTSPRIQTDSIQPSFVVSSSGDSQISNDFDEGIVRWPKHLKRVYLTDINENLIFHERWLNGSPEMTSLHFNFSLSSPINFDAICLCSNLRYLHISDCVLGNNKNTALNLINAIKKLDKLESLSLERVIMENNAWIQLFDDVLTTSPTLSSIRIVDSINQTTIVSSFVHASKIRIGQLDKIELKLKGFGEKDKLLINSLIEQLMLHGNAKTVIADCKFLNPNQSGEKDKSKKSCIVM
ncbi:predicted protein [Naegleria gruberi]|uniref:Predicted protein n=1 Tax=Naegleria gruberi TaxID=5762 RepID=D2VG50_NAEGR|nr:uncharacterized protein NAEGRDRAFT_49258 [Naegleria gruberi]EFC44208.1 predicted protein [Naegleria gruberi]|eukprot:XP_002676952.1 predicted protein [Naegleria gruberi strain NEG-M]